MDALDELKARVNDAVAQAKPLRLRAGGTKDFYGHAFDGELLDLTAYRGIVNYEPTELVITARGGTPLAEIEAALAVHDQMLVFEPPFVQAGATLGGAMASGLSGPRRAAQGLYYGAARDFVLGAKLLDGRGQALTFGGQVMKNVAGYDVARFLTGSLGTLGILLEVSLKVLPRPVASQSLSLVMDEETFLAKINAWGGKPLAITASAWFDGVATLRLEGARAAVKSAVDTLGGERVSDPEADAFWRALRDQESAFFPKESPQEQALWRLSVPSTAKPLSSLDLQGTQLIEWGGAQRWWRSAQSASSIREAAQLAGGHATLIRPASSAEHGVTRADGVFTPLAAPLRAIHQQLKTQFDPHAIFNRGRMFSDL